VNAGVCEVGVEEASVGRVGGASERELEGFGVVGMAEQLEM
jgi:hypothetical protein